MSEGRSRRLCAGALGAILVVGSVALSSSSPVAAAALPLELANALTSPGSGVTIDLASFVTQASPDAVQVRTDPIAGFPTTPGGDYVVLSTGDVASLAAPNSSPSTSKNFGSPVYRGARDVTTLKVDFTVAAGFNCLASIKIRFLSEEFPEYVGSQFNDAMLVELDANDWSLSGTDVIAPSNIAFYGSDPITVNTTGPASASPANAAGTTYDAATPILSARSPITAGAHSLYISIFDLGDSIYDSTVLLDDFKVSTVADPAAECPKGAFSTEVNPPTRFVPLTPARIVDSRAGLGLATAVPALTPTPIQITGKGGVPANGVAAAVINVTATETQGVGYIRVTPSGGTGTVSNLNVERAGQTLPNLVTVPVSATGAIDVFSQGGTHLIVDVFGYYTAAAAATAGRFIAVDPTRVLDTRSAIGVPGTTPVPANGSIDVQISGTSKVPAAGVSAVVLNVTATESMSSGYVTVWPTGVTPRPGTSNLNLVGTNQTIANQVIVPLGAGGRISLYSLAGTHLVADVAGYFTDDTAPLSSTGLFIPVTPNRLLDTRAAVGVTTTARPEFGTIVTTDVVGRGGIPAAGASALIGNTTMTETALPGFLTVFPKDILRPTASSVNADFAGQTIANHTIVRLNAGGISLFTSGGSHMLFDVAGFYTL